MSKPFIYISGPITNNKNSERDFAACEEYITEQGKYIPLNPARQVCDILDRHKIYAPRWRDYMTASLIIMMQKNCNDIILIEGWQYLDGARVELSMAIQLDYRVHLFFNRLYFRGARKNIIRRIR